MYACIYVYIYNDITFVCYILYILYIYFHKQKNGKF